MSTRVLYILDCGHVNPGSVNVGSLGHCIECGNPNTVIKDVHTWEWHAWCDNRGCPFSQWTGLSKQSAEFAANQHARKEPGHVVKAGYRENPTAVRIAEKRRKQGVL